MKRCPRCKETKEDSEFKPNASGKFRPYCTPCMREYWRDHRAKNPEAYRVAGRKSRQKHWDQRKRDMYAWRKTNPEQWKAICRRWQEKHRKAYSARIRTRDRREAFE